MLGKLGALFFLIISAGSVLGACGESSSGDGIDRNSPGTFMLPCEGDAGVCQPYLAPCLRDLIVSAAGETSSSLYAKALPSISTTGALAPDGRVGAQEGLRFAGLSRAPTDRAPRATGSRRRRAAPARSRCPSLWSPPPRGSPPHR
jgi:hypothetical protein